MTNAQLPASKTPLPSVMFHLPCRFQYGCLFRCNELSPEPGPGVLLVVVGELLDQSPAGVVDGPGHDDPELDEKVAIRLAARGGNTLSLESQLLSRGASRRDGQRLHTVERRDVDPGAEDRLGNGDWHLDHEISLFTLEVGMGLDGDDYRHIAPLSSLGARFPLSLEPELCPGIHAGRDLDDQVLRLAIPALDVDRGLAAADGGQERDGQVSLDRSPASRSGPAGGSHPTEQVLEDPRSSLCPVGSGSASRAVRAEELGEIDGLVTGFSKPCRPLRRAGPRPGRGHALERGVAVTIKERPLLGIRKDIVGLLNFLEPFLRGLVARVDVRVVLPRQCAIGLLDGLWRGVASDPQGFVIVVIGHVDERPCEGADHEILPGWPAYFIVSWDRRGVQARVKSGQDPFRFPIEVNTSSTDFCWCHMSLAVRRHQVRPTSKSRMRSKIGKKI